ncbi:ROK family transcriptional regulator [Rubellimicrobium mesophilum]|uniref:ROK family transcriptional regulator n=1 Tax=Rubellimicrobium mesophilum TaxID=1123067 RepID=UPI00147024E0|nr:ROK family transcriptional regulator [Rubellimicrobium mesophilum]
MSQNPGQAAIERSRSRIRAGTNIGNVNEHNRRVIMQQLRVNRTMSRAQIARATGLVPQTISNIVEDLEREGLVVAAEPVRSGRGQPATPYSLSAHGAFAFGMQIDPHRVRAVAVNLLGEMIEGAEQSLRPGGLQANFPIILSVFHRVASAPASLVAPSPRILGLGVAMPAPTGVHTLSGDPWIQALSEHHPIVRDLQKATGLEVSLHHDASAAAVAERLNGCAVGMDDFVLIFVGYGLGAGIYVGGGLLRGQHRLAGELGLVTVHDGTSLVPLETLTSLGPLYVRLGLAPNEPDLYERLDLAIRSGNTDVGDWAARSALHLTWTIDAVECLLDPEGVVLAGQMPEALMSLLYSNVLNRRSTDNPSRTSPPLRLLRGSSDPFSVAIGAAADPIARAFDPDIPVMAKTQV